MIPNTAVEPALDFAQIFVAHVRKGNNGPDEDEERDDLGVHGSNSWHSLTSAGADDASTS